MQNDLGDEQVYQPSDTEKFWVRVILYKLVASRQRFHDNSFNVMNRQRNCYICNEVVKEASASLYSHFEGS